MSRPALSHREAVQDMRPHEAVEYLLCVIEGASQPTPQTPHVRLLAAGFTGQESVILAELLARPGEVCSRDRLMDVICADRHEDDWPEEKIIDVHVHRIRKKLPAGCSISCIWGVGYRAVVDAGVVLPWDAR